jgi:hypothetical protein
MITRYYAYFSEKYFKNRLQKVYYAAVPSSLSGNIELKNRKIYE